jgi:hypothetical protein
MQTDGERIQHLFTRFSQDPADPELVSLALDLADRLTLDQLQALATNRSGEVAGLFERVLSKVRSTRRTVDEGQLG